MLSLEEEYEIKDYLSKGDQNTGLNRHCRQFGIQKIFDLHERKGYK